jgi:Lrp/AsnC family transcriptional regulator for asnA, asnC and gidA
MQNIAIAKELGISEYTVRKRLKRLIDADIIRIVAISNPVDLGFQIVGNIKIRIEMKKAARVLSRLNEVESLNWITLMTGNVDIDADFYVRSIDEFHDLVYNKISKIDGVRSVETSLMVQLVKDKYNLGTAWD